MGEVFAGRYELVDPVGRGGSGSVWRAWDRRTHRYLAAKVLRQSEVADLVRFMREQSFRIDHPHVLAPLGWAGEDDRILMTMPIVRGGSVAHLLRDFCPLPAAWTALLLDQLLNALEAIHSRGLVHRDVKPSNLLLHATGRGRPHLLLSDFGIATRVDEPRLTHASAVLGTAGYVAPEQIAGADPDPTQDLYAVGQVCCELTTGVRPDRSGGLTPALPEGAPLWDLVRALVAADPAKRPASAHAARDQLAASGAAPPPGRVPADDGLGVEVFDHLPELPDGWAIEGPRAESAETPTIAPTSGSRAVEAAAPSTEGSLRRTAFAIAALGLVMILAAVVLFLVSAGS